MTTFAGKQPIDAPDPSMSHPDNTGLAPYTDAVTFTGVQTETPTVIGAVKRLKGHEY